MQHAVLMMEFVARNSVQSPAPALAQLKDSLLSRCSATSRRLLEPLINSTIAQPSSHDDNQRAAPIYLHINYDQLGEFEFKIGLAPDTIASPYYPDFNRGKLGFRLAKPISLKQDIYRAIGAKPGKRPTMLDCNAGLGRDTMLFAAIGCPVTSIERHPLLFLALDDALRRCRDSLGVIGNFCRTVDLQFGDAMDILPTVAVDNIDCVYLDPMFPQRDKSAKVKQEAQLLQAYCHDDNDAERLLELALTRKFKRICVKRPLHAPYLRNEKPTVQFKGKSTRFDVYIA